MIDHTLVITRVVKGTQAEVLDCWRDVAQLRQWWWPHWPDTTYELDARVGGRYRIVSPAAGAGVEGVITEVELPWTFTASWLWLGEEDAPEEEFKVEISELSPGETLVTVRHGCAPWNHDDYWSGWDFVLDNLEQLCETGEVRIEFDDADAPDEA